MKTLSIPVILAMIITLGLNAALYAAPVVYEPFNYSAGAFTDANGDGPAANATGLTGNYRMELGGAANRSLSYVDAGSLPFGILITNNNQLRWAAPGSSAYQNYLWTRIDSTASNALNVTAGGGTKTNWISFLGQPKTSGDGFGVCLGKSDGVNTPVFGVSLRKNPSEKLALDYNNTFVSTDYSYDDNAVFLFVGRLGWSKSGSTYTFEDGKAWLIPSSAAGSIEKTETWLDANAVATVAFDTDSTTTANREMGGIRLMTASSAGNGLFDEVRVGSAIGDVVVPIPEPATAAAVMLTGLLAARKR